MKLKSLKNNCKVNRSRHRPLRKRKKISKSSWREKSKNKTEGLETAKTKLRSYNKRLKA